MSILKSKQLSGSLDVTASFAITASYALNSSTTDLSGYVTTSSFNSFTSSVVTTSSFNNFTSSVVSTSSFNGFTGSVITTGSITLSQSITGSLNISGSFIGITGSLNVTRITSSLFGTSSWATNAITASYSTTLAANLSQPANNQVRLVNSAGTAFGTTVTINNVSTASIATTANTLATYNAASVNNINTGLSGGDNVYSYIVRAAELEQSKHTTINIYNFINFT